MNRTKLAVGSLLAMCAMASMSLAQLVSDQVLITHFASRGWSAFYSFGAMGRALAVLGYGSALMRFGRRPVEGPVLLLGGVCLGLSSLLLHGQAGQVASFLWLGCLLAHGVTNLFPLIAFTAALSAFSPRRAPTALPLIAAGGTLGTVLAGVSFHWLGPALGGFPLLLGSGVVALVAACLPRFLPVAEGPAASTQRPGGFCERVRKAKKGGPLVRGYLGYFAAIAAASVAIEVLFKGQLKGRLQPAELSRLLGKLAMGANIAIFVAQFGLAPWLLKRLGVARSLWIAPVAWTAAALTLFLLGGGPGLGLGLMAAHTIGRYGFAGPAGDVLLSPAPQRAKIGGKIIAKGAAGPLGAFVAGALLQLPGLSEHPAVGGLVVCLLAAGLGLASIWGSQAHYDYALTQAREEPEGAFGEALSPGLSDKPGW